MVAKERKKAKGQEDGPRYVVVVVPSVAENEQRLLSGIPMSCLCSRAPHQMGNCLLSKSLIRRPSHLWPVWEALLLLVGFIVSPSRVRRRPHPHPHHHHHHHHHYHQHLSFLYLQASRPAVPHTHTDTPHPHSPTHTSRTGPYNPSTARRSIISILSRPAAFGLA